MKFRTRRIDADKARTELEAVTPTTADPLDAFRDANGQLVESEAFFAFIHAEAVHEVLRQP